MRPIECQRCKSDRVLQGGGKSSDMNNFYVTNRPVMSDGSTRIDRKPHVADYVPDGLNIGGGDYYEINLCLDCGQMQGEWPIPPELPLLGEVGQ